MKKILSFDGGGIRGVISATFLKNLEKDTGIEISTHAEVLAGTSTGSIIAGALAIGMSAQDILDFYSSMSSEIFQEELSLDHFLHLKARYPSTNLYQALEKALGEKAQTPLSKIKKELVIPTVILDDKILKRWRMQVLTNRSDITLIDAMMESTAAPTFFPSFHNHIDGGMAANDPSAVAYAEHKEAQALLSFGTGYTPSNISKGEDWGSLSWILDLSPHSEASKAPLLTMLFDVQDQMPGQLCQLLMGEKYYRQNLELAQSVRLNDVTQIPSLIEETEKYIQSHPKEWKTLCQWTLTYFSS